ncbi:carboxylesterase family protein [Nocardia salmonicida]|uniref:carboxylesterase family protein n=1 Tax=Nocardia salmonicida TaxID=53431 RepID=UPI0036BAEDBA
MNIWTPDPGGVACRSWCGSTVVRSCTDPTRYRRTTGLSSPATGVVLVAINYRLGASGFAVLDGAPDNRGLLDQLFALAWVRENVRAFGGDPGYVTVFGESAGAMSVASLLSSPAHTGLFARAIISGVPLQVRLAAHGSGCDTRTRGPFVFDTLAAATSLTGSNPPQRIADEMHSAWIGFATDGDPGWPRYAEGNRVMTFDEPPSELVDNPRAEENADASPPTPGPNPRLNRLAVTMLLSVGAGVTGIMI